MFGYDYVQVCSRIEICPTTGNHVTAWIKRRIKGRGRHPAEVLRGLWVHHLPKGLSVSWWQEYQEMKRYMVEVSKVDKKFQPPKDPILKGLGWLPALLADPWWDDGSPREICSLTVRWGVDSVQISLNDKENEQSITTNAETFVEALKLLDEALGTGKNLWRKWGKQKKGK